MKKIFLFAISAILLAGMWSCDKTKAEDATLTLDPATDILFTVEGGTEKITVTTNQKVWKAESDQTWCEVIEGTGEFTVTAKINETEEAMPQATITVTAGEGDNTITRTIKANQPGKDAPVIPKITMANFQGLYFGDMWENNKTTLGLLFYNGTPNADNSDFTGDYEVFFVECFNGLYDFDNIEVESGTYTPDAQISGTPKTYIPGKIDEDDELEYSVFRKREGSVLTDYLVSSGDIKLDRNGNTYTLTATVKVVNIATDIEEDMEITFTGTLNDKFIDEADYPLPDFEYRGAHLYYYEVRSFDNAGYYSLQLQRDVASGVSELLHVAFYHNVIDSENKGDLKLPTGTFRINENGVVEIGNAVPGVKTGEYAWDGSYQIMLHSGFPSSSLLMKGGKMKVEEIDGEYLVVVDFQAEDPETGNVVNLDAYYRGNPLYTYVQSDKEKYTTTFTKTKDARIIDVGNGKSWMLRMKLTDDAEEKEISVVAYVELNSSTISKGTYTFDFDVPSAQNPLTMQGGTYSMSYGLEGTYYQEVANEEIKVAMTPDGGTMTVDYDGTNYDITFDFTGKNWRPNKEAILKGSFNGPIPITVM